MSQVLYAHVYEWKLPTAEFEPPGPGDIKIKIEGKFGDSIVLWLSTSQAATLGARLTELTAPAPVEIDHEARYADEHAGEFAEPNPNAPLPLTPADIEQLQIAHTKKALDFIYASLNRTHET